MPFDLPQIYLEQGIVLRTQGQWGVFWLIYFITSSIGISAPFTCFPNPLDSTTMAC